MRIIFRRCTIAAVVCDQLTFAECRLHKEIVMEAATNAMKDHKLAKVGVLYVLEVRAQWANEMAQLGKKFVQSEHVKVQASFESALS